MMMAGALEQGSVKIVSIMGIPVRVHFSWLIVFGLIAWSLSTAYFPSAAPDLSEMSYWMGGLLAALLLFISVALHELSHSYMAKRYRLGISSITLFIFGGVSQMKGEPPTPEAERKIALAGPLASFLLSLIFFLIYSVVTGKVERALFSYISQLNLVLGVFNLIPGFPMDGGRVVRAFLWKRSNDFLYATRRASAFGRGIAVFFIVFGLFFLFAGYPGALWLMLIGWFLHTAAQSSYQQASLQENLRGVRVEDVMTRDVTAIPSHTSLDDAVNGYFLKYGYGGFPVMHEREFLGFVTLKDVKDVPKERWSSVSVADVIAVHHRRWEVSGSDDLVKALELMINEDKGRLAVMENGELVGIITRNGIARYVQIMAK